jgi:transcription elongation GreA/GreB family factor
METSLHTQKQKLDQHLMFLLQNQIEECEREIASIKDSRNNDTKSSAGDKFETGRSMMQMELDKQEAQLDKLLRMKNELSQIDMNQISKKVNLGSLVMTNFENYFISIAFGKISNDELTAYAISLASPMGSALLGKKINDEVLVNGRKIRVVDLL